MDHNGIRETRVFLLMEGGPLFRLEKRIGLIKENTRLIARRALIFGVVTWVPLLLLSALQGTAYGSKVPVPFLCDFSAYSRFLLAIPLLLLAEIVLGARISHAVEHFISSGVVSEKDYGYFDEAIEDVLRLRDSVVPEVVIVILAYIVSAIAFRMTSVHVSTWYADRSGGAPAFTWAGLWLELFCVPLFQFLLLRWFWRLILWFRFLGRMGRIDLQLFPTHPDEAGGIGFIGEAQRFFGVVLFAISLGTAGVLANEIVYDKLSLQYFAPAIAVYAVIALAVIVGPLCLFTGKLFELKRNGLKLYGTLATAYTGSFDRKWIRGENPDHEALLGTGDIQSLADLGNSYSFIQRMNLLPVNLRSLINLVVATLLPMTPLLLTVMPLKDVLKLLAKVLV